MPIQHYHRRGSATCPCGAHLFAAGAGTVACDWTYYVVATNIAPPRDLGVSSPRASTSLRFSACVDHRAKVEGLIGDQNIAPYLTMTSMARRPGRIWETTSRAGQYFVFDPRATFVCRSDRCDHECREAYRLSNNLCSAPMRLPCWGNQRRPCARFLGHEGSGAHAMALQCVCEATDSDSRRRRYRVAPPRFQDTIQTHRLRRARAILQPRVNAATRARYRSQTRFSRRAAERGCLRRVPCSQLRGYLPLNPSHISVPESCGKWMDSISNF